MNPRSGKLIVIEGLDGSGKTSQSKFLAEQLNGRWTGFPNRTTPFGQLIDGHLKGFWSAEVGFEADARDWEDSSLATQSVDAMVFQALQTCNRLEVAEELDRMLKMSRSPVVCDRYWASGYAYGSADGLDPLHLEALHSSLLQPDLFILLDVPLAECAARLAKRGDKADRYEKRGSSYYSRVEMAYQSLWRRHRVTDSKRWVIVDGLGTFAEVAERLRLEAEKGLV